MDSKVSYGIKETKEALALVIGLANVASAAAKDGKIDMNDIALIFPLISKIQPAIDSVGVIPKEIGDLSSEEAAELITMVGAELAIVDEKAKVVISQGLVTIASIAKLVQTIRA